MTAPWSADSLAIPTISAAHTYAAVIADAGYTNIEKYINGIADGLCP